MTSRVCPASGDSSLSRLPAVGCGETHFACRKRLCSLWQRKCEELLKRLTACATVPLWLNQG